LWTSTSQAHTNSRGRVDVENEHVVLEQSKLIYAETFKEADKGEVEYQGKFVTDVIFYELDLASFGVSVA